MGTAGNLELRIGRRNLVASTSFDGTDVYRAISRFAGLLKEISDPSPEHLHAWFHETSKELLLTPGWRPAPHYVILHPQEHWIRYSHYDRINDLLPLGEVISELREFGYVVGTRKPRSSATHKI